MGFKNILRNMPFACLVAFVTIHLMAVSHYPGGHRYNPAYEGYSWTSNYYCDLFHRNAHNGQVNHSRPLAFVSLAFLELTFLSFWINLTNFWHIKRRMRIVGNIIGVVLICSLSLVLCYHDTALKLLMLIGIAGFIFLVSVLYMHKENVSLLLTLLFFAAASTNYLLWATQSLKPKLPLLQNFVLLTFGIWVSCITSKVVKYNKQNIERPEK